MVTKSFALRFSDLIFIVVFLVALASGGRMLGIDSDLGRHLTLGNYILDERVIPTRDLFSHTRFGASRPPYEWLSQVIFALAYRLLGLDGVIIFASVVIALTFALVYQSANQRSGSPLISLILVLIAAGASSLHWLPRPHIFTFLFLAIWVELLGQLIEGKFVRVLLFPVIMLVWANLHGGFIFGILAWFAYFTGWLWETRRGAGNKQLGKSILVAGGTSLFATIVTPDLWRNWEAVLNNRSAFILNRTVETMRPNLTDPSVLPYSILLLLTVLLIVLNWSYLKPQHLLLLGGLGFASLLMARNIPLFAIACVPALAGMGARSISKLKTQIQLEERFAGFGSSGRPLWSILIVLLASLYFANYNIKNETSMHQFDPAVFPVEAVNFIEINPQSGNVFNEFNWGGYLLYRMWSSQHQPVFLDSQSDFYGEQLIREYDQIMNTDNNWLGLLDKYKVNWVLVSTQSKLSNALSDHPGWEITYTDETSVIFRKIQTPIR